MSAIVPFAGEANLASTPLLFNQSNATDNSKNQPGIADEIKAQLDAATNDGLTFNRNVAQLVAQMPPYSYTCSTLSLSESTTPM